MGYKDSMNLYQAFNMNGWGFVDPWGLVIETLTWDGKPAKGSITGALMSVSVLSAAVGAAVLAPAVAAYMTTTVVPTVKYNINKIKIMAKRGIELVKKTPQFAKEGLEYAERLYDKGAELYNYAGRYASARLETAKTVFDTKAGEMLADYLNMPKNVDKTIETVETGREILWGGIKHLFMKGLPPGAHNTNESKGILLFHGVEKTYEGLNKLFELIKENPKKMLKLMPYTPPIIIPEERNKSWGYYIIDLPTSPYKIKIKNGIKFESIEQFRREIDKGNIIIMVKDKKR
jgi:hypothetical protein